MLIHALTVPIDDFDDMTPLPAWLNGDPARTRWALQAVLALADAGLRIGWNGDMRHLPSVGRHDDGTPFLVVKQDTRGTTFIVTQATETPAPWLAGLTGCCLHVDPRDIGDAVLTARRRSHHVTQSAPRDHRSSRRSLPGHRSCPAPPWPPEPVLLQVLPGQGVPVPPGGR